MSKKIKVEKLRDFIEAVKNVEMPYVATKGESVVERVFAYELYHQLRKIMECPLTQARYDGLFLNGEIHKSGCTSAANSEDGEDLVNCYPDLVLHAGNDNTHCQAWFCEIKRSKNSYVVDDLNKMIRFDENESTQFQQYISLIYGPTSIEDLINTFKEHIMKSKTKVFDRTLAINKIQCIFYNGKDCKSLRLKHLL